VAAGIERASGLEEDTISLALGVVADSNGARGTGNIDLALGRDIFAFASGDFANSGDWTASAGLKMRW
tara:strand:- start:292 stop:495 length:204 start_codon:yes stop_codon:yes gene_type:complete